MFSLALATLLNECRRERGLTSPTLVAVFLLGNVMPGKQSSACSDLETGVWVGSTETRDFMGKTRSSAEVPMKEDSDKDDEKGELPVGVWGDLRKVCCGVP